MKIEKISDNQIKFILNRFDLEERDINIKELAYGSEKAQELFREMMEEALLKFDFQAENSPLMIEAIPISSDSIMIIVTKVSTSDDIESRFNNLFAQNSDMRKYRERFTAEQQYEHFGNDNAMLIFSFDTLDEVSSASSRLSENFSGSSSLYKDQDRYFLLIENNSLDDKMPIPDMDAMLSEYGLKHLSTDFSKQYLLEHTETIVKSSAINIMANI